MLLINNIINWYELPEYNCCHRNPYPPIHSVLNFNLNNQVSRAQIQINDHLDHSAFKKVSSSAPLAPFSAEAGISTAPFDKIVRLFRLRCKKDKNLSTNIYNWTSSSWRKKSSRNRSSLSLLFPKAKNFSKLKKKLLRKLNLIRRRCRFVIILEKRWIAVAIRTNRIMPKVCAVTATIETEDLKSLGSAVTKNFTQLECAKIATLTTITAKEGNNYAKFKEKRRNNWGWRRKQEMKTCKLVAKIQKTKKNDTIKLVSGYHSHICWLRVWILKS